jgi:hypothetical protein
MTATPGMKSTKMNRIRADKGKWSKWKSERQSISFSLHHLTFDPILILSIPV